MRAALPVALALAVCAAVVAGALWMIDPQSSPDAAEVIDVRRAAPGPLAADPDLLASYDLDTAMELAGTLVPSWIEDYYFVEVDGQVSDAEMTTEIAGLMRRCSDEKDYMGIVGENHARTKAIYLDALSRNQAVGLSGATFVYIGRAGDEAELRLATESAGAVLVFSSYAVSPVSSTL